MRTCPSALALGLLAGTLLAGCAPSRPPRPAVTGVVTFEGEPLPEGRLTLFGDKGEVESAMIQPDGTFTFANAPPGAVRVAVQQLTPATAGRHLDALGPDGRRSGFQNSPVARARSEGPVRLSLPERYADPDRSGLSFTVVSGPQRRDFHLGRDGPLDRPPEGATGRPRIGLHVGQLAPDIDGEDLDGRPFALREYRGRVVVLTFWGHW